MSLRIAVLLTNDDNSAFAAHYPNDGQKVIQLLQPLRSNWSFEVVSVKDGELPANPHVFDGYVITGSPASVNDDGLPWLERLFSFIRELDAVRRPLVGLCFGHQAVARALGGQVARHAEGWGLGTAPTHWTQLGPWMTPGKAVTTLMAAHNEQVTQMPRGAVCMGGNDFCAIGSMLIGQHTWTTQFHPEMPLEFIQALLDHLAEKLDESTIARAHASLTQPADDSLFGQWMVQFLETRPESRP